MGSCSCGPGEFGPINVYGDGNRIIQLVKADSIEEANKLLEKGHFVVGVYWNSHANREEYVLGFTAKADSPGRPMGFRVE